MYRNTILVILAVSSFIIFSGCHDGCEPEEMKCDGDKIMVCNGDEDWFVQDNCADVEDFGEGYEWTCCVDPEDGIAACLPVEVCEEFEAVDGGA